MSSASNSSAPRSARNARLAAESDLLLEGGGDQVPGGRTPGGAPSVADLTQALAAADLDTPAALLSNSAPRPSVAAPRLSLPRAPLYAAPGTSIDGVSSALARLRDSNAMPSQPSGPVYNQDTAYTGESFVRGGVDTVVDDVGGLVIDDDDVDELVVDEKGDVMKKMLVNLNRNLPVTFKDLPIDQSALSQRNSKSFLSPMSVGGSVRTHGSAGSGASSSKTGVTLFYAGLDPSNDYCCGLVGQNGLLFCTKKKSSCQVYVRGGKHSIDRAKVGPDLVYINKNASTAWFSQCVEEEFLSNFATAKGALPARTNLENWKAIFSGARLFHDEHADQADIDRAFSYHNSPVKVKDLKTPLKGGVKVDVDTEIKNLIPLSENNFQSKVALFIPDSNLEDWKDSAVPQSLIDQVKAFSKYMLDLTSDVDDLAVTLEFCASAKDVSADILSISASLDGLKASIGDSSNLQCPDLITSISLLNEKFEGLFSKVNGMELGQAQASTRLEKIEHDWSIVRQSWLPSISQHAILLSQVDERLVNLETSSNNDPIEQQVTPTMFMELIKNSSQKVERIKELEAREATRGQDLILLQQEMIDMKEQLALMSSKTSTPIANPFEWNKHDGLASEGVSFGQFHFEQGERSILTWIKKNMSRPRPGLFNDLNTLFELMPSDMYVEKSTTLGNLHSGNRIGFTNSTDSTVATSFDNVLPGLFARIRSSINGGTSSVGGDDYDMATYSALPGIPTHKDWDAGDTNTGRKFFILRSMKNAKSVIDGCIRDELEGEAQVLAFELLSASIYMGQELVQFISGVYQDLSNSGRFDDQQAWGLTCKFVKRIFTEIGDARVVARDNIHCNDLWFSTAKIIYGILRAHKVMKEFMRLNLRDHPSISSEMVKFVCYSQPASDTSKVINQLSELTEAHKKVASTVSKHESRIKKLENWREEAAKTLKKVN
jgi:hypothetical protein